MGRRTLLTPQVEEKILLAIRAGAPLKIAAGAAGIAEDTLAEWMSRGRGTTAKRKTNAEYARFARAVDLATHETHTRIVGTITSAALTNWQAANVWLRLRYPAQYAERTEITGADGGPISVEVAEALEGKSDAELAAIVARLRRGSRGGAGGGGTGAPSES